jgi:hypothetical protein
VGAKCAEYFSWMSDRVENEPIGAGWRYRRQTSNVRAEWTKTAGSASTRSQDSALQISPLCPLPLVTVCPGHTQTRVTGLSSSRSPNLGWKSPSLPIPGCYNRSPTHTSSSPCEHPRKATGRTHLPRAMPPVPPLFPSVTLHLPLSAFAMSTAQHGPSKWWHYKDAQCWLIHRTVCWPGSPRVVVCRLHCWVDGQCSSLLDFPLIFEPKCTHLYLALVISFYWFWFRFTSHLK